MAKPGRGTLTLRDMAVAVGVLVAIVLVVGFLSSGAGFAPGGPRVDRSAGPTVDAPAQLHAMAPGVPFPLVVPAVPPGWRSNSVAVDPVGTSRAVRVGYVTPDGYYLQLQQTDATEGTLLHVVSAGAVLPAQGPQDVGKWRWVVYGARPAEPVWIADTGDVRFAITGSGSDDDYRRLAAAASTGAPAR